MRDHRLHNEDHNRDRWKSALLTAIIWSAVLLFIYFYKISEKIPIQNAVTTKMRINFGDHKNGHGTEEPAEQQSSKNEDIEKPAKEEATEPLKKALPEKKPEPAQPSPQPEKILTGNNKKLTTKTQEPAEKVKTPLAPHHNETPTKPGKTAGAPKKGDGKGNAAIGNLLKGRGTKSGTQGTGHEAGNDGDPLGGDGDGDSKIGIDRRLISYIPGTMGRGGQQPSQDCAAEGAITIAYTVDKAGNVVSARRQSGISDPCVVATGIA